MSYRRKHIGPKIRSLRKKKKIFQNPFFWIALISLAIIGSILYFVLFYPEFRVSQINISGNQEVSAEEIENLISLEVSHRFFLISKKKLSDKILNQFINIESVDVQKKFPSSLFLKIKERELFSVFCADKIKKNCFSMDSSGIVFKNIENLPDDKIVIVKNKNEEIFLGKNVIEKNVIDMIKKAERNLRDNFQIYVQEVLVSDYLILKTSEKWEIYFDINSELDLQIAKMNILLKDEITSSQRKNLQYIYLQYKDRAYYK